MKRITHLIFLIHPCVYEMADAERLRRRGYTLYLEREQNEVKPRWLAGLARMDEQTLFLQLQGSKAFFEVARQQVGDVHACWIDAEFPGQDYFPQFYGQLTDIIRAHVQQHGLEFDPATVTSELWGESFEGCVPGYGGAFAHYLGLCVPPKMDFDMTVFDSRFLQGARRWEALPLPGTDVEAWLFDCHDGIASAQFQARLSPQWLDRRPILLRLDPTKVMVCNKLGFTVWPEQAPRKGDPQQPRPFVLTTADQYWLRMFDGNFDALRDSVAAATLCA